VSAVSDLEHKATTQRQLVSDVSKEAVLREVMSEHEKRMFESMTRVQQLEGAVRKYYASYANDGSSGDVLVTGEEPLEMVIRACGREPAVASILDQLDSARKAASLRIADWKSLKELVQQCKQQREEQAQKVDELRIQEGEEQQEVDARVKEIIKNERPQEPHRRTAKDELQDLEALSRDARSNYLASAHNRRGGYLWPNSATYDQQLRAAEMRQLTRTSHALQEETGVRSAVRFLTDHPYSLQSNPWGAQCAHAHAFSGNRVGDWPGAQRAGAERALRDVGRVEAEALPEVGADIKSVFVTKAEMPNAYASSTARRGAAQPGFPLLKPAEWPVDAMTSPRSGLTTYQQHTSIY